MTFVPDLRGAVMRVGVGRGGPATTVIRNFSMSTRQRP